MPLCATSDPLEIVTGRALGRAVHLRRPFRPDQARHDPPRGLARRLFVGPAKNGPVRRKPVKEKTLGSSLFSIRVWCYVHSGRPVDGAGGAGGYGPGGLAVPVLVMGVHSMVGASPRRTTTSWENLRPSAFRFPPTPLDNSRPPASELPTPPTGPGGEYTHTHRECRGRASSRHARPRSPRGEFRPLTYKHEYEAADPPTGRTLTRCVANLCIAPHPTVRAPAIYPRRPAAPRVARPITSGRRAMPEVSSRCRRTLGGSPARPLGPPKSAFGLTRIQVSVIQALGGPTTMHTSFDPPIARETHP